jgi:hypothetical protein
MSEWMHDRKGKIVGEIIWQDETWCKIRLSGDHQLRYMGWQRGLIDPDGSVITTRRSLLREVVA